MKRGKKTIKIAQWGGRHIIYLPVNIADRMGLFAAEGLDVSLYHAGNDDEIFDEVAKGRADFGIGDPTFVALNREKYDTLVVASIVTNASTFGITHHPEIKPFSQISDFVGLRIGTFPRPATTTTMLEAIKAQQPRLLKTMNIVETDIGQQAYLLAADKVDMIMECEPMISAAAQQGLRIVCNMSDFFPEILFTGLMTSAAMIEKSPEIVSKIVRAVQKALTICRTQPDKAVAIGQELFPNISHYVMTQAVQRMLATKAWPEQTIISPQAWANALKLRQDVGELDIPPSFESVVDQRFAYAAL
jgi:NitT/TauT family transport system substrate-binding protein